jgi:hypothetical protein
MIFKKLGAIGFALAFLSAIVVFTRVGTELISIPLAKVLMLIFGCLAIFMNILSFRFDSKNENNNILFWVGTMFVFIGFYMKMQYLPMYKIVLIVGLLLSALSFFFNPFELKNNKNEDLLDD